MAFVVQSFNRPHPCARRTANSGAGRKPGLYKKYELEAGVGLAAEELAGAGAADEFAGVDDGAAAQENGFGRALDLDALEHGIVHAHVMRFGADDFFLMGVKEDKVGVGADGDGAFARVEAEKFCWRGGDKLNKTIRRKMLAMDAAGVDQAEAMLNARPAVGNFCEIVPAEFLLLFEAERTMIGRDDLQCVSREALPKPFLVPFFTERRRENVFRPFEAGHVEILNREVQVLRASFGVGGEAAVACFADFFKRIVAGEMHDVKGGGGHFHEAEGPGSGVS